ncbi:MAG: RuBisCO large subunit C-terminal-like domain-containing protein [Verrucomicrobiota bacterium]|jgi:ribulose 1,5-bisphosphate carboxylase large subunit-like protein
MIPVDPKTLTLMKLDLDQREEAIRRYVYEALESLAPADLRDTIVAAFFVAARSMTVQAVGGEISYHMTSGVRSASPGSLLDQCGGKVVDYVHFEPNGRTGVVRVAFPLKMLLHEDGSLFTTDILHITAGEGTFGLTEHADIKLVRVDMSDESLNRFPGPAHGAPGVRQLTGLADAGIAFGTILKPCTGITPEEESAIISQAAANPMFIFVKEDENFLPGVSFAPLRERLRHAQQAIERAKAQRGGKGLIFAPHIGAPPQHLPALVDMAAEAGMNGIMFSEYYTGGAVRMAREQLCRLPCPPVIYGHNGGISCRTRHVYREVLDYFARLDGVDFRQTAPLSCTGESLLRPVGLEWRKCEEALSRPAGRHPVVMMARAGGLDQGNIIQNLMDVSQQGSAGNYLFLAGSAINGIKNKAGSYDPGIGALAMEQALQIFKQRVYTSPDQLNPQALAAYASSNGMPELAEALRQRYRL